MCNAEDDDQSVVLVSHLTTTASASASTPTTLTFDAATKPSHEGGRSAVHRPFRVQNPDKQSAYIDPYSEIEIG